MSEEEWEEVLDPDVYSIALDKAVGIVNAMKKAWEYVQPVYEELEDKIRSEVRILREPSKSYDVIAVDSTFTPTISLRGIRTGFVLLAAVTYPKPDRPLFRLKTFRDKFDEEEEPSSLPSAAAKKAEILVMRDLLRKREDFDVLVRDGDFPPANALFSSKIWAGLTELAHEVMKMAEEKNKGLVGLVKRISTSMIAYKFLGDDLIRVIEEAPRKAYKSVVSDLLSDPVLGWLMLDAGEYIEIGRYGDDFGGLKFAVSYFSTMVKRKESYIKRMTELLDHYELFNDVKIAFYRPLFSGGPVIKLTGFNIDLEDFASFSAKATRGPTYPDFINLADTACIEHARVMKPEMIMLDALRVASAKEGLDELRFRGRRADLVALQNVQKIYLFFKSVRGESAR